MPPNVPLSGGGWRTKARILVASAFPGLREAGDFRLWAGYVRQEDSQPPRSRRASLSSLASAACAAQSGPSVESTAVSGVAVESTETARQYFRVISATPAITEIVYILGGEDRLVGIANYSDFPPRAKEEKPEVGGILNIDYEKILALRPDLILTPPGAMAAEKLTRLGIEVKFIPNKTLADIERSFEIIGGVVGKAAEGRAMAERFGAAIAAARERRRGKPPVRALVVIGYEPV